MARRIRLPLRACEVDGGDKVKDLLDGSDDYRDDEPLRLSPGQRKCLNPRCQKRDQISKRYGPDRDIGDWKRGPDIVTKPLVIDGEELTPSREAAQWNVVLECGHHDTKFVANNREWTPADGFPRGDDAMPTRAELQEMEEVVKISNHRSHLCRLYDEGWPVPAPFEQCALRASARHIVRYRRVGWVVPRTRQILQERIERKERELQKLREQLQQLQQRI